MPHSQSICDAPNHPSLDEIGLCLSESLHIGDGPKTPPNTVLFQPFEKSDSINIRNDADKNDLVEIDKTKVTVQKELLKSDTFPCLGKLPLSTISTDEKGLEGVNDIAEEIDQASCGSNNTAHTLSISLPTPMKLVSAIKGTREKLGAPRDKLRVTWAPDVYDPPPSAPSTAVINYKPRRKSDRKKNIDNKKYAKNKQKKKYSKGSSSSSSSKDKKLVQKYYKGNDVFYKSFEDEGKLVVEGFDCGSTFLKASVTNLHFSMAEAT